MSHLPNQFNSTDAVGAIAAFEIDGKLLFYEGRRIQ
jgi:hypothetical protein